MRSRAGPAHRRGATAAAAAEAARRRVKVRAHARTPPRPRPPRPAPDTAPAALLRRSGTRGPGAAARTARMGRGGRRPDADGAGRSRRFDVPVGQRPAARLRAAGRRHAAHGARDVARPGHRRDEPVHRRAALGHRGGDPRLGAGAAAQVALQPAAGAQRRRVGGADAADHPAPEDRAPAFAVCGARHHRPDPGVRRCRPARLRRQAGGAAGAPRARARHRLGGGGRGAGPAWRGQRQRQRRRPQPAHRAAARRHRVRERLRAAAQRPHAHAVDTPLHAPLRRAADAGQCGEAAADPCHRTAVPGRAPAAHRGGRDPGAAARRRRALPQRHSGLAGAAAGGRPLPHPPGAGARHGAAGAAAKPHRRRPGVRRRRRARLCAPGRVAGAARARHRDRLRRRHQHGRR